jgi:hypothetical protein
MGLLRKPTIIRKVLLRHAHGLKEGSWLWRVEMRVSKRSSVRIHFLGASAWCRRVVWLGGSFFPHDTQKGSSMPDAFGFRVVCAWRPGISSPICRKNLGSYLFVCRGWTEGVEVPTILSHALAREPWKKRGGGGHSPPRHVCIFKPADLNGVFGWCALILDPPPLACLLSFLAVHVCSSKFFTLFLLNIWREIRNSTFLSNDFSLLVLALPRNNVGPAHPIMLVSGALFFPRESYFIVLLIALCPCSAEAKNAWSFTFTPHTCWWPVILDHWQLYLLLTSNICIWYVCHWGYRDVEVVDRVFILVVTPCCFVGSYRRFGETKTTTSICRVNVPPDLPVRR